MPEGPEVASLCKRLKMLGLTVESAGKHLLYKNSRDICFDISFGLVGKIKLLKTCEGQYDIEKLSTSSLSGEIREIPDFESIKENLGVDWITSDHKTLFEIVDTWRSKSKKIAGLLIDQHEIAGIGVAWATEILADAGIHPTASAIDIDIDKLVESIISVRNMAMETYDNYDEDPERFIDRWFMNLYFIRRMKVYKKGTEVMVYGRKFYSM